MEIRNDMCDDAHNIIRRPGVAGIEENYSHTRLDPSIERNSPTARSRRTHEPWMNTSCLSCDKEVCTDCTVYIDHCESEKSS